MCLSCSRLDRLTCRPDGPCTRLAEAYASIRVIHTSLSMGLYLHVESVTTFVNAGGPIEIKLIFKTKTAIMTLIAQYHRFFNASVYYPTLVRRIWRTQQWLRIYRPLGPGDCVVSHVIAKHQYCLCLSIQSS